MSTLFISDLHLDESRPDCVETFLQFLATQARSADALYILGDLFEAWIGDDNRNEFNHKIIHALMKLTAKGVPVYLMRGNRDFLIGRRFAKQTGCHLLKDPKVVKIYGHPVLLMHGDTLNSEDLAYIKLRKYLQNKIVQFLFLLKPLQQRRVIAKRYRAASKIKTKKKSKLLLDVIQKDVEAVMQKHQVSFLIHGHTHKPGIHAFNLKDKPVTRIVLGAWDNGGHVLICDEDEKNHSLKFELQEF